MANYNMPMSEVENLIIAEKIAVVDGKVPGFTIDAYVYRDRKDADGAVLKFEPGSYARVLQVAHGWRFEDTVVKGSGWFLASDLDGKIKVRRVSAGENLSPIVYGDGMVTTYIAGKEGLEIHEMSTPPFDPEITEIEVLEKSSEGQLLNPKFWQVYNLLRQGSFNF